MRRHLHAAWQAFWSLDAVLFVVIYTALLLVLPIPKTKAPVSGR